MAPGTGRLVEKQTFGVRLRVLRLLSRLPLVWAAVWPIDGKALLAWSQAYHIQGNAH